MLYKIYIFMYLCVYVCVCDDKEELHSTHKEGGGH